MNEMNLITILTSLKEAPPEVRFFLAAYINTARPYEKVQIRVVELANQLGVSDRVVTKSLSFLTSHGYFLKEKAIVGKGRPKLIYSFSPQIHAILDTASSLEDFVHAPLIGSLLSPRYPKELAEGFSKLRIVDRLLLCVLLLHANVFGIVKQLSLTDIANLTGLKPRRLAPHILGLESAGYLSPHVPGAFGRHVMAPSPSSYRLKLDWNLRLELQGVFHVIFESQHYQMVKHAIDFAEEMRKLNCSGGGDLEYCVNLAYPYWRSRLNLNEALERGLPMLVSAFNFLGGRLIGEKLQLVVAQLATDMIKTDYLKSPSLSGANTDFLEKISNELKLKKVEFSGAGGIRSIRLHKVRLRLFSEFIQYSSTLLAEEIAWCVGPIKEEEMDEISLSIFPEGVHPNMIWISVLDGKAVKYLEK